MQLGCNNGSFALPPKRESHAVTVIEAADASPSPRYTDAIVSTKAQDRLLELIEREQLPSDVRHTLAGALAGDLRRQQLLFQAMVDTWPRLQKALAEVKRAVRKAPWLVQAWRERGQKPKPAAEKLAREIEGPIWSMKPDVARGEKGFEGMVEELAMAYFFGHHVLEVRWLRDARGYRPRSAKVVPPRFYGYPYLGNEEDRLMFDQNGGTGAEQFVDFPEHRFLIAINGGHPGHAAVAAPLRALAVYWLAAVYGLKWLTQFAQVCGVPFRWAEYATGDEISKKAVCDMLANIGSAGWGAFPAGTKINFVDAGKGANTVAQKVLIDLADEQCDIFILGQTLTSSAGDKGSQALGTVHEGVRQDVIEGVCDFVGEILTHQLVPSIYALNYGETRDDLPGLWAVWPEQKDLKAEAERFSTLKSLGIPIRKEEGYEALGLQIPADGDELLFELQATPPDEKPETGQPPKPDKETDKKPVEASDAGEWHAFHSKSGTLGIPRREMPQIKSGDRAAMVQFLRARGIESREELVDAATLKPTQAEYAPGKVAAAKSFTGGDRAILVSEDNHVVDGHHQWLAAADEEKPIRVIRLMAPIARVLMMVHRMPSTTVAASIREDLAGVIPKEKPMTVDKLSAAVLEGLTGVSREWLSPVRPLFERLAALAMAKQVTDEDFLAALEKAQKELPEIFDLLDTQALEDAFTNAISSAALAGSTSRYE